MINRSKVIMLFLAVVFSSGCEFASWLFPAQPPCTEVFSLRVVISPDKAGTCSITPDIAFYEYGTVVNVSVTPETHYQFSHWEGDAAGSDAAVSVNMSAHKSLIAVFKVADGFCGIAGTVSDSAGGVPVAGTTVTIGSTGLSATTDANGSFNLISNTITPGSYEVLAAKPGMAGSKMQDVIIKINEVTKVDLIQTKCSYLGEKAVDPPTISVTGITKNMTYSCNNQPRISVSVAAGSCLVQASAEHNSIYLKIGSVSNQFTYKKPELEAVSNTNTLSNYLCNYCGGSINVKIISYDLNNNRSELNIPIVIVNNYNSKPISIKPGPAVYSFTALTFGKSLQLFNIQQPVTPNVSRLQALPYREENRIGSTALSLSALNGALADSSAYVNVFLLIPPYATGVNSKGMAVYHAPSQAGPYSLAGKTALEYKDPKSSNSFYKFQDYASLIMPGKSIWYKLAWYNDSGEGPQSEPVEVQVLPVYSLQLQSPANNSVLTDTTPLLQWQSTTMANATRYDELFIIDNLSNEVIFDRLLINSTQTECPALAYGKLYKWNILSQYELIKDSCLSISLPSVNNFSSNGYYYFSINPVTQ